MEYDSYIKYIVSSSDATNYVHGNNELIIAINKSVVFGKYNLAFRITYENLPGTWLLHAENDKEVGYLAFMLNDPIMLSKIFGSSISRGKKYRVLKSKISSLPIPKCDDSLAHYYAILEMLFQEVYNNHENNDIKLLMLDIFASIRLSLSFELHSYSLMKESNISIFDNWKKTIDNVGENLNNVFEELLSQDNELLNNVRRFQLLLGTMQKNFQDGLAAK